MQFSAIRRVQRFDEPETHDLTRTGSWNFRHDVDLLRNLVGRQTGAAVSQQRVDIQFTAFGDHKQVRHLAQGGVAYADHRAVDHLPMKNRHFFDFGRRG